MAKLSAVDLELPEGRGAGSESGEPTPRRREESGMEVEVRSGASSAPPASRVRRLLGRAARGLRDRHREVSVLFCGDRRMAGLNRRWRRENRSTDVLAFPAAGGDAGFLGDIVISVPYAMRQARRRGEPPSREIDRLLVHGYLHLLGYDHETDRGEMDALEARLRRKLGIEERPTGVRSSLDDSQFPNPGSRRTAR